MFHVKSKRTPHPHRVLHRSFTNSSSSSTSWHDQQGASWRWATAAAVAATMAVMSAPDAALCEAETEAEAQEDGATARLGSPFAEITGTWVQDMKRSDSMSPFFSGLGVPGFVAKILDRVQTTLILEFKREGTDSDSGGDGDGVVLHAEDKTFFFGSNFRTLAMDGDEVEATTRGGRKRYMVSSTSTPESVTVQCRMHQRGDGWFTRQRWTLQGDGCLKEV